VLLNVREKLVGFESMTWNEILHGRNTRNHEVDVADFEKAACDDLVAAEMDDVDSMVSLRLSGRERIWGILDRGVLSIVWWDPEHRVCPSRKKHT